MKTIKLVTLLTLAVFFISAIEIKTEKPGKNSPSDYEIKVFRQKRELTYNAIYIDDRGDTITNETLMLRRTDSEDELDAYWVYNFTKEDEAKFTGEDKKAWVKEEKVKLSETAGSIKMPTPKENQYIFTILAAVPYIEFPFKQYEKYYDTVEVDLRNYPDVYKKRNLEVRNDYKFIKQETRIYKFGALKNCIKIEAEGFSRAGLTYLVFYYHPNYGFTEMYFTNHDRKKIILILEKSKY